MFIESANTTIVSGYLERVAMRYKDDGTPLCGGTVRTEESGPGGAVFKLYVPFEGYNRVVDALGDYQPGDYVLLTGKLFWRKSHAKDGREKSGLAVMVQKCTAVQRVTQLAMAGSG